MKQKFQRANTITLRKYTLTEEAAEPVEEKDRQANVVSKALKPPTAERRLSQGTELIAIAKQLGLSESNILSIARTTLGDYDVIFRVH